MKAESVLQRMMFGFSHYFFLSKYLQVKNFATVDEGASLTSI